jgi:outer membrane protein OmpA-like peptidoglycan-associated protein
MCLAAAGPSFAQEGKDIVEINLFGGNQDWATKQATQQNGTNLSLKIVDGGAFGARIDANFWKYVGLEVSSEVYGTNNVCLNNVPGIYGNGTCFGARDWEVTVGPILYLVSPEHRFRPFVTVQGGLWQLYPTSKAENQINSQSNPLFGPAGPVAIGSSWKDAFNWGIGIVQYGGGFKIKFNDRFGFRTEVRGNVVQTPNFGIPRTGPEGTLTLAKGGGLPGYQATAGLTMYLGKGTPLPVQTFTIPPAIDGPAALCPGETAVLKLPVTDSFGSHTPKYKWTVNGQDQATNAPELTVKMPDSGDLNVTAHVEPDSSSYTKIEMKVFKKTPAAAADRTLVVKGKEYKAPALACSATPTELELNGSSSVTGTATGSDCSGTLRYSWAATEGSITGEQTAAYSAAGVPVAPEETKKVTVTGTVTDARNATANCSVDLSIHGPKKAPEPPKEAKPVATHVGDIVFAPNNSRVNNCAKRVLEDLYKTLAANPGSSVVLVGHEDAKEAKNHGTKKHPRHIDEERVLNTAAVLSGGTGTCQALELSRAEVNWVGTAQDSEYNTHACETSVEERKGQAAGSDADAKNRRVEIWLVPQGADKPAAAAGAHSATTVEKAIKAKGCPK